MTDGPQWILASGSPRRQELLRRILDRFAVIVPEVEEWEPHSADPVHQVEENALLKGRAVAARFPEAVVIAADTTVALGRRLFAKPADREAAVEMLQSLSGQEHQVVTGMALLNRGREHVFNEVSRVVFRSLSAEDIDRYLERVHVFDKAGSYAIQEEGHLIVDRYTGSLDNIIGLPVQRLRRELVQLNWAPLPRTPCQ